MDAQRSPSDGLDGRKSDTYPSLHMSTGGTSGKRDKLVLHTPLASCPGDKPETSVDQNDPDHRSPSVQPSASDEEQLPPKWEPAILGWWSTMGLGFTFILFAIFSEIVFIYSRENSGFNINLSGPDLSRRAQFLKSFALTIIFGPLFSWFTSSYNAMKRLQPFVDMSQNKEGVSARDSVFVSYIVKSPESALVQSFRQGQWIICILSFIAVMATVFFSLAGAYFQISLAFYNGTHHVNISGTVGLNYDPSNYIPFVIAAGGLDESLRTVGDLSSPSLARNWNADSAGFWMFPTLSVNKSREPPLLGNVSVTLSAVGIEAICTQAQSINVTGPDAHGSYDMVGTLPNNCSATATFANQTSSLSAAVVLAPFACVNGINTSQLVVADPGVFYHPVAFSLFRNKSDNFMAFCYTQFVEHNVTINAAFSNNYFVAVNDIKDNGFVRSLGLAPSGLSFDNVSTAIAAILSDSLLLDSNVIDREFNVTQNIVQYTYTMYQALIAQLTLLASPMSVVEGPSRTSTFRLEANPPVAHSLTALCAFTGITLFALFSYHHLRRGDVRLGAEPSGIATFAALVSRSKFLGETDLRPGDSIETIEKKLGGLRFKLLKNGGVDAEIPPKGA